MISKKLSALTYLSGSRKLDMALLGLMALVVLYGGRRLKVYYMVNAARVEATRLLPDGTRDAVVLPRYIERSGTAGGRIENHLQRIERRIRRYATQQPEAQSYEWSIRYSVNSPKLDRKRRVVLPQ